VGTVTIGADIGQKVDPTALVVAEITGQGSDTVFTARHVERLALGTRYPAVAERLAVIAKGLQARDPKGSLTLRVDSTGVGAPVVDIIRVALRNVDCRIIACTFTHGDRCDGDAWAAEVRVGKAFLVSRLQALLQTNRIKLPRTAEAETLARELLDFEIRVDQDANDKYGAFRVGSHDDLVTALGLAALVDDSGSLILWMSGGDE
jgi:hypothetical protein